jgi:hypothetical protein
VKLLFQPEQPCFSATAMSTIHPCSSYPLPQSAQSRRWGNCSEFTLCPHTDVLVDKMLHDTRMAASTGRTAAMRVWVERRLWAYSVEKLRFWPKFENNSPHSATMIFRRGVRQKEGSKRCCVSLEPFGAIFTEYSQGRAFGGNFRNPIFRVFQQNRPKAVIAPVAAKFGFVRTAVIDEKAEYAMIAGSLDARSRGGLLSL